MPSSSFLLGSLLIESIIIRFLIYYNFFIPSFLNRNFYYVPINVHTCSLSQYVIVPASVTDAQLTDAAKHFQGKRPPVWSWTNAHGAALVKMPELLPTITERMHENIIFENIRKSHPQKNPPVVIELNKEINVKLIAAAFTKFINLCSPGKNLASRASTHNTLYQDGY